MAGKLAPFNLDILLLTPEITSMLNQIKVLDIYDGFSRTNFHPEGLFSTEIFGKAGEERRNRQFAYVKLNVEVFHPLIFKAVCDLKELYLDIMKGSRFAVFNEETKDFEEASAIGGGQTGYNFFMKHFNQINFIKPVKKPVELKKNEEQFLSAYFKNYDTADSLSTKRHFNVELLKKYKGRETLNKLLVLPAGLRDHIIDNTGKPSEDEINNLYRSLIATAGLIENIDAKNNLEQLNNARFNMQIKVREIYLYLEAFINGKNKLIQGGWASRKIYHSTRNVISSAIIQSTELFGPKSVSTTQTIVGLYQFTRGALPWAQNRVQNGFLSQVFVGSNTAAQLTDKKTLKKVSVDVDPSYYDDWMTDAGLEATLARFGQEHLRHENIDIGGYWLGLIYKGPDNTWRFVQDKDELPEGRSVKDLHPITFAELIYLSIYREANEIPCLVTRYPVANFGSVYPSFTYLRSTIRSEVREMLGPNWEPTGVVAQEFPIFGLQFFDSQSPSVTQIKAMNADHDGDMCNYIPSLSDNSRQEIRDILNSRSYYVGVDGKMAFSADTDVVNSVLRNMTS